VVGIFPPLIRLLLGVFQLRSLPTSLLIFPLSSAFSSSGSRRHHSSSPRLPRHFPAPLLPDIAPRPPAFFGVFQLRYIATSLLIFPLSSAFSSSGSRRHHSSSSRLPRHFPAPWLPDVAPCPPAFLGVFQLRRYPKSLLVVPSGFGPLLGICRPDCRLLPHAIKS
jgi:hypothetical protein